MTTNKSPTDSNSLVELGSNNTTIEANIKSTPAHAESKRTLLPSKSICSDFTDTHYTHRAYSIIIKDYSSTESDRTNVDFPTDIPPDAHPTIISTVVVTTSTKIHLPHKDKSTNHQPNSINLGRVYNTPHGLSIVQKSSDSTDTSPAGVISHLPQTVVVSTPTTAPSILP